MNQLKDGPGTWILLFPNKLDSHARVTAHFNGKNRFNKDLADGRAKSPKTRHILSVYINL